MKNIKILTILIVLICQLANSQDNYYFYSNNGLKVPLFKDNNHKILFTTANNINGTLLSKGIYKIKKENLNTNDLSSNTRPLYILNDGNQYFYKDEIVLKFKSYLTRVEIDSLIRKNNLELIKESLSFMLFKIDGDALEKANEIYESGNVLFCTPNFYGDALLFSNEPNDQYFHEQWYLHNIGQGTNDGNTTTFDADIDALEAWNITKGNENIIVAVVDEGVTSNHPDLPNSRQVRLNGSNFAWQYDGSNNPNDPSPINSAVKGNNHGNACAGLIAATQGNSEGITGVAPLIKIMPVKIPFGYVPMSIYAEAIDFAVQNNASIISNSWGFNSSNSDLSPVINSSIQNAINSNIVVLFAAGNTANLVNGNIGFVSFPANANINDLITVGASDRNDTQANYSPKNPIIDVVAPSHTAYPSQISGESFNIWTIDIPDNNYGYNKWRDNNYFLPHVGESLPSYGINHSSYTGRMGGTSASTPIVAGVIALVKSINPNLTPSQINEIIYSTTDKVGGYDYNWDNNNPGHSKELGYGRVNAYAAVLKAQELLGADLYVKDNHQDTGAEPNTTVQEFWESVDIWVRNNNDGGTAHQNPLYKANGQPNFIKIRVRNRGGQTSTGYEKLVLNWAKASTALSGNHPWQGGIYQNGNPNAPLGGVIDTLYIPQINANQEHIITIPWVVPNPYNYQNQTTPWGRYLRSLALLSFG